MEPFLISPEELLSYKPCWAVELRKGDGELECVHTMERFRKTWEVFLPVYPMRPEMDAAELLKAMDYVMLRSSDRIVPSDIRWLEDVIAKIRAEREKNGASNEAI